jgi:hypothetical protein
MIKKLQDKGYRKPLLTSYVSSFDPDNDPDGRVKVPWRMVFDRFIPEGAIFFLPETLPDWDNLTEPVRSRFYSAHFAFTVGQFSKEVQHDPEFYFHGEEISIAVRAFTHGYDLFNPHKIVVYHEYTRKNRTKQWDDDKQWVEKNNSSHLKNRKLFSMDGEQYNEEEFGIYGFGKERTLRDYEIYSGINFKLRAVQQYTIDKNYPPNPYNFSSEVEWLNSFSRIFKHCIDVPLSKLPENDYDFLAVIFKDGNDNEIYRKDAEPNEIINIKHDQSGYGKIWREFITTIQPKKWIVWPHSISKGWCELIEGNL